MSQAIKTVTIYGASSSKIDNIYINTAKELGKLLASHHIACINGGGGSGIMGAITDSVLESGGKVTGIIPRFMVEEGWIHPGLTDVITTPDMHTRKKLMAEKADACVALPGGIGTLEELLEIITWKQLGLYNNPIILLNTNGYYSDLLAMLARCMKEKFMHSDLRFLWNTARTAQETLEMLFSCSTTENSRSLAAL
jgi:TIGR00730 family protein